MIRFAWLQFRVQAIVGCAVLAALVVILGATRPHLIDLYNATTATCGSQRDCAAATKFMTTDNSLQILTSTLMNVVPVLIGMFWCAPLIAREFETGTFRLTWTQGVSRTRWLATKLAVVGFASVALVGLLSLAVTWWSSPLDRIASLDGVGNDRWNVLIFGARNIAPLGYTALAVALGITLGLVIRRIVPAMAIAMVGFAAIRVAMLWVRPRLIAPLHKVIELNSRASSSLTFNQSSLTHHKITLTASAVIRGAWVYSTHVVDKLGHAPSTAYLLSVCPVNPESRQPNYSVCIPKIAAKFHEVVAYQPASRYWVFQWYETGIFLAAAVALSGFSLWWIHRSR